MKNVISVNFKIVFWGFFFTVFVLRFSRNIRTELKLFIPYYVSALVVDTLNP